MNLHPSDKILFGRDCEVIQIPVGTTVIIPAGTEAIVTQTLGGNITLSIPTLGLLAQVSVANSSALVIEGAPIEVAAVAAQAPLPGSKPSTPAGPIHENVVWETLKTCYDPEIPVNIVDLGLIYDMKISPLPTQNSRVDVKMTLTARGCGMGPAIAGDAQSKILALPGVEAANVEVVWDPPWNPQMITDEGKRRLGIA